MADKTRAAEPKHTAHDKSAARSERARPANALGTLASSNGARLAMLDHAHAGVAQATAPLPHLDRIQAAFGAHDVRDTRATVGGDGGRVAAGLGARAYTVGNRVAFRGQPDLATAAHEAAHVVQQRDGVQLTGGVGVSGDRYERAADAVSRTVVAGGSAEAMLGSVRPAASSAPALQRDDEPDDVDLYPFSDIYDLPSRESYERKGRIKPRNAIDFGASLISLDDVHSGRQFDLGGTDSSAEKLDLGAFGHPQPIPQSTGDDTAAMPATERTTRLAALEVAVKNFAGMLAADKDLAALVEMTAYTLRTISAGINNPNDMPFVLIVDPDKPVSADRVVPSDPAAQSREIVRTETVYDRLYDAFGELAQQINEEQRAGSEIAKASKKHTGGDYDVGATTRSLGYVRQMYGEAARQPLQPRIITTFNDADTRHGEVISELVYAKLSYYEHLTSNTSGGKKIATSINAWASDIEQSLKDLEQEAPKLRAARDAGTLDRETATKFSDKAALVGASIEALGEYDMALGAHDELSDNWAAYGYEDVKRIRWRVEQMHDAARDGDLDYLNVLLEDHRNDPIVAQFYASVSSIPSIWQVMAMFAIAVIASVASAGVGLYVGALFAAAESWVMIGIGLLVRAGVEALVFTIIDRTLSTLVGMAPTTPFWKDFLWNWGLFFAMHGVGRLMGKSLKTMGSLSRFLVSHAVNFGMLQIYGFIKGSIEAGHLLSADEVMKMTAQNLGMMVGMGLGMKGFEPFLAGIENKLALKSFRGKFGGDFARIETERTTLAADVEAYMRDHPDATEADSTIKTLDERAKTLEDALKNLLDTVVNDPLMTNGSVRREAAEFFEGIGRKSVPEILRELGLNPRADLLSGGKDGQFSYAPGEAKEIESSLDKAGVPYSETDTAAGKVIEIEVPGKGRVDLIERPPGERANAPLTETELGKARKEIADDAAIAAGGTRTPEAYTLADTPQQTGAKVAKVARNIAKGLAGEGIKLGDVKADATAKGGPAAMKARGTLTVEPGPPLVEVKVPFEIEVAPTVDNVVDPTVHGERTGHAKYRVVPDKTTGGWTIKITLDARLANDADVAHHLRHELREAGDAVRELARNPDFDVEAQQRASSLEDPSKTTLHDRAEVRELGDLFQEQDSTIARGDDARKKIADSKGGNASQRKAAARGADARARIDKFLDSLGFADPPTRAAKTRTVLEMLGVDAASPLGKYIESYGARTDAAVARRAALDRLDAPTRTAVEQAIGPYADSVPAKAIQPLADALAAGDTTKAADHVRERAAGNITSDADLVRALETDAKQAREAALEASESGGKRTYKATDPQGHAIRGDGLSKQQDDAFREDIVAAEKREKAAALNSEKLDGESALDVRYRRYLARLANAVELKPGEPMNRTDWEAANPQLRASVARGRDVEVRAIKAVGATGSNNAKGAYSEFKFYDRRTNRVVTARADAFKGQTPVESKYVDANSSEQVVYDTSQTRAERAQGGKKNGHIMVLSQDVEPGSKPAKLRPSEVLADGSTVYFYDPARDAITYKWDKGAWQAMTGPVP